MAEVLCQILRIYLFILFARVIISFVYLFSPDWRPVGPIKGVVDVIYGLTEPPLALIRRVVPQPASIPFDLGFIVLYVLLSYVLRPMICG